jgi:hypothetical protein
VNDNPDTPIWRELRRRAARSGILDITLRASESSTGNSRRVVDLTWPGGETESLRFHMDDNLDALAHALAHELRIPLEPPARG